MAKKLTQDQMQTLADAGLLGEGLEEPQTNEELDLERAGQDADRDIIGALLEIEGASDARWKVHRVLPAENAGFVCEMTSAELTLANIANVCGPGKYRVHGTSSKGRYIGQRSITIAKPAVTQTAAVVSGAGSGIQDMIALMRLEQERSREHLFKWAALIVPVLVPVLPQIFGGRKETSLAELTTALANMKQLAGNDSDSLSKVQEVTALIGAIKEMSGDGDKTGSTVVDLVRDGVKEIGPMVSAFIASRNGRVVQGAPPHPQRFIQPNPAQPAAPPNDNAPAQPEENDPMMALLNWLQSQLEIMTLKAARNSDAELCAEWLADSVPDGVSAAQIRAILGTENWWQQMITFYPPVTPYQGWFTELRTEILALLDDAEKAGGEGEKNV